MTHQLLIDDDGRRLEVRRSPDGPTLVVQHAAPDRRPFLHPLRSPDGGGELTEDTPPHHPWQHGIYVGLNDVNGVGFWTEGLLPEYAERDGTFHPRPIRETSEAAEAIGWTVVCDWRGPRGDDMLVEEQRWALRDRGERLILDLDWILKASVDLHFGQYSYGGLFLRMPYRAASGGTAINSEGRIGEQCEGQAAHWVAVSMPIQDVASGNRDGEAGIAILTHPDNPEFPMLWRVDSELGIGPGRCIAGAWDLTRNQQARERYRLVAYTGRCNTAVIEVEWERFQAEMRTP